MATVALLAWSNPGTALDPAADEAIERHHGRRPAESGLAVFPGVAEALAAGVGWLQQAVMPRAIAVTVAELTRDSDADDSAAAAIIRRLAADRPPGEIVATDIVRILLPEPDCGSWDAGSGPIPESGPLHVLRWQPATPSDLITVVVAEDVAIIRAGIVSLLGSEGIVVVGEAADYAGMLETVRATRPQLLVTDVRMPPGQADEGLRGASLLRAEQPGLAVLVLSQFVQPSAAVDLLTQQTAGIGYLLKERVTDFHEFLDAARRVAAGGTVIDPLITKELLSRRRADDQLATLGDRERAVLELIAQGLSNAAIADALVLSPRTVESHVRSIMTKLDLWDDPAGNRRVRAVIRWLDQH